MPRARSRGRGSETRGLQLQQLASHGMQQWKLPRLRENEGAGLWPPFLLIDTSPAPRVFEMKDERNVRVRHGHARRDCIRSSSRCGPHGLHQGFSARRCDGHGQGLPRMCRCASQIANTRSQFQSSSMEPALQSANADRKTHRRFWCCESLNVAQQDHLTVIGVEL